MGKQRLSDHHSKHLSDRDFNMRASGLDMVRSWLLHHCVRSGLWHLQTSARVRESQSEWGLVTGGATAQEWLLVQRFYVNAFIRSQKLEPEMMLKELLLGAGETAQSATHFPYSKRTGVSALERRGFPGAHWTESIAEPMNDPASKNKGESS